MFKVIGIVVLIYTAYAAVTGQVHAKSGVSSRKVTREDTPIYFWVVIVIYGALGVSLLTLF